eukprot:96791_1
MLCIALKLIDDIVLQLDSYLLPNGNDLINPKPSKYNKIFQVGFNKCATRSIAEWFENNQISAVHWIDVPTKEQRNLYQFKDLMDTNHEIIRKIYNNHSNNKPLLHGYDNHTFYGDFGVYIQQRIDYDVKFLNDNSRICTYKLLIDQYPNSLYILNIRNVNKWLRSRYLHYKDDYFPLAKVKKAVNISDNNDLVFSWKV